MHLVKEMDFSHIDDFDPRPKKGKLKQLEPSLAERRAIGNEQTAWKPERLGNGKWACNHKCRDKTT